MPRDNRRSARKVLVLLFVAVFALATLVLNALHAAQYSKPLSNGNTKRDYHTTKTTVVSTAKAYAPITTTKCQGAKCGYKRDTQAPDVPIATGPSPVIAAKPSSSPVPPVGNGSNAHGGPDLKNSLLHRRKSKGSSKKGEDGGNQNRGLIICTAVWAGIIFVCAVAKLVVNWDEEVIDGVLLTVFIVAGIGILVPMGIHVIGEWPGHTPHNKTIYAIGYALAWVLLGCLLTPLLVLQLIRAN